jgi:NitT/TauT family transport system substrate-binding protein/putative hydroxymethylpyrimidine transport system substrate-binding protein
MAAGYGQWVRRLVLIWLLLALAAAGCGGDDPSAAGRETEPVTLSLDFTPNAVHAPIYAATRDDIDEREGLDLQIRKPGPGPDALKLIAAGKVDLGVLDIHDLAIAREQGADLVAIGALVGKPLAALIGQPGLRRPRDLEGKTVGVSGLPSDPAFLRAMLEHDGGDYDKVKQVTIGFAAVARLLSRRVDAVPAFWNAEGVALKEKGRDVAEFRVDDYGAPPYPEVVLVTSRRTLEAKRDRLRRTLKAIAAGMQATLDDPESSAREIAAAAESNDVELTRAQLDAVSPVFARGLKLDRDVLERWAGFDADIGIVKQRPDVERAFDFSLVG